MNRYFMEQLAERATERMVQRILDVEDAWKDANGLVYGDIPLNSPEDFVMYYIDLRERGVLDNLRVVSPEVAADLDKQFERDAAKVMGVA